MRTIALPPDCDEQQFRAAARSCLAESIPPEEVVFTTEDGTLFGTPVPAVAGKIPGVMVPRAFAELVSSVLCHTADDRFALLYRLLWRIQRGERHLLDRASDPDVIRATRYDKAVRRDCYRMQAFVRFAERAIGGKSVFTAWFEPQHRVMRRAASFFVDRFTNMDWLIATPFGSAAWLDGSLNFGPASPRPAQEGDAVLDELWTTYYRATFNPARLRVKAMMAQMPKRHWATMPETALVPELVQDAREAVRAMEERAPDTPPKFAHVVAGRAAPNPLPAAGGLDAIRREAHACERCALHVPATQTVFGEGPPDASIVFVGEQPGDQEDLEGRPFVGPAGALFDRALADAGIDRSRVYVTNAVKHFKFEPRGKRRIHQKPGRTEVVTCRFWLEREIAAIRPRLIVALGGTAVLGITGRTVPVTKERGRILDRNGVPVLVTVHPSYMLRIPETAAAAAEYRRFVDDLAQAKPWSDPVAA